MNKPFKKSASFELIKTTQQLTSHQLKQVKGGSGSVNVLGTGTVKTVSTGGHTR